MLHIVLLLALLSCLSCSKDPPSSCSAQPSAMVRVLTIEAGTATHDRTARLAEVEGMLGDAAEQAGCIDIVVLPELFAFLHTRFDCTPPATPIPLLASWPSAHATWLVYVHIHKRCTQGTRRERFSWGPALRS